MPERIQLRRAKGWRLPDAAVVVARPTKWGNPFRVDGTYGQHSAPSITVRDTAHAVEMYRWWIDNTIHGQAIAEAAIHELTERNLACWCPLDQPCHADVLLEIANGRQEGH